jgi:hypothetical protein
MATILIGVPVLMVFVIGGMKLLRFPFWLIFSILVAAGWTTAIIVMHHNLPHLEGYTYVALTPAVAAATILLLAWMYAIARWTKPLFYWSWYWLKNRYMAKYRGDDGSNDDFNSGDPGASAPTGLDLPTSTAASHEPPAVLEFHDDRRTFDPHTVFHMVWHSIAHGFRIEPFAPIVALLCGWTFVWLALWCGALGGFIGLLIGLAVIGVRPERLQRCRFPRALSR